MKELDMNMTNVSVKAVWQSYLTDHIKSKHEEVRYECDQCKYKASEKVSKHKHKVSEYKASDKVSKHKT